MKFAGSIAAATLLLAGIAAPVAGAKTLTASGGGVTAKVTYTTNAKTPVVSSPQIALTGSGGAGYSGAVNQRYCGGGGYCEGPTLSVANLGGAHDPVAAIFTGGAHCCSVASVYWQDGGGKWQRAEYDFSDPGFELEDLDHNGQQEFLTADDRFAYLMSAFAASGMPIDILSFSGGKFADVTRNYPALIRRDAARYWKGYQSANGIGPIGVLAPWAADEDSLGHQSKVATTLSAQVKLGRITARQAQKLQHYLKKFGYTQ